MGVSGFLRQEMLALAEQFGMVVGIKHVHPRPPTLGSLSLPLK
jgi:hypothetical protein